MACYVSGDACESRIFRAKLQTLSSNHGDQERVGNIISISKWVQLCSESKFSPYETTINQILLFLYDLFRSGVGYSVMNTAPSSLSTFINIDGVPIGQHPVIIRFIKGIFNIKPALPKYKFTWDVGIVITYISKIDTDSLKYLSQKLATLLMLLCGQRCEEILSLLDIRNLDLSENMCVISTGDILKTSGPKSHIGEIKFHAYPNDLIIQGQRYFLTHNSEQTIQGAIKRYVSKMGKTNTQRC